MEKDATQEKLEKLHGVLETERSALREVLQAARKAVDDLKVTLVCAPTLPLPLSFRRVLECAVRSSE